MIEFSKEIGQQIVDQTKNALVNAGGFVGFCATSLNKLRIDNNITAVNLGVKLKDAVIHGGTTAI